MAFAFAVHRPASKRWLVADVRRVHGSALRPALMRPGLITWKSEREIVGESGALGSPFARVWGRSLGTARDAGELIALAGGGGPFVLHVFDRPRDEPAPPSPLVEALDRELREAAPDLFTPAGAPSPGERVLDVVVAEGDPIFAGVHRHERGRWAVPGGAAEIEVPEGAPSRAYRKLEEALVWSGLEPRPGEHALELGAAPGGAALAMVRRGVSVLAVDPAAMDPRVLAARGPSGARVTHHQASAADLARGDLPRRVDWLLLDMNVAPQVALAHVERILPMIRRRVRAMVLTLKLNDERTFRAYPRALARIAAFGLPDVRAAQLPSNRDELCVIASR